MPLSPHFGSIEKVCSFHGCEDILFEGVGVAESSGYFRLSGTVREVVRKAAVCASRSRFRPQPTHKWTSLGVA